MDKWTVSPKRVVPAGCVFVTVKGAGVGTVFPGVECAIGRDIYAFQPHREVSHRFVQWAIRFTVADVINNAAGDIPGLSKKHILDHPIEVPCAAEQRRVVEAIDSYFSRLDDAVATLECVQANLTRYRASVLKAAVEGRLVPTEAELARSDGRDYEPASVLLERILKERRRLWEEAELAKMVAKGKPPKDDKWKAKYKEPAEPDTDDLPELPEGWCWATTDSLCWQGSYGTSQRCAPDADGPPVLRIPNVQHQAISLEGLKFATGADKLSPDGVLRPGDFVFIRTNGSKSLIGRGALVDRSLPSDYYFASYLIRLRVVLTESTPRWFGLAWHSEWLRRQLLADAASSAGQHNVSLTAARQYVIPMPPATEQQRILTESDRLLTVADSNSAVVGRGTRRCARLRQSILKWAFEGNLVDQDPNDEPASVLLERIKAERDAVAATAKPKKRARRKKAKS